MSVTAAIDVMPVKVLTGGVAMPPTQV